MGFSNFLWSKLSSKTCDHWLSIYCLISIFEDRGIHFALFLHCIMNINISLSIQTLQIYLEFLSTSILMWNTIFECLWGWILLKKMILLAKLTNFWDLINLILLNYIIIKLIILRIDTSIAIKLVIRILI